MTVTPEERLARIEGELAAMKQIIADQFSAFNLRLDDVVASQVRNLGKRLSAVEEHVHELREHRAREEGKKAGSKAVLTAIIGLVSGLGGVVGAVVSRMF